jgi:hypothetical protein
MRSVTRFATLLFATAALAACEDKADFSNVLVPITPVTTIAGTFNLTTLNGQALPVIIDPGPPVVNLTASSLILVTTNSTTGTFTLNITTDDGTGPVVTTTTGNYTLIGTALSLTSGGTTVTGTWDGANMITLTEFGQSAVYIRP